MYDIYYAHHRWKYKTGIELYELDLILRYFPHAKICNPSVDRKINSLEGEEVIMAECLDAVRSSDILVFSSMDGCIGKGVYQEINEAKRTGKIIFYIYQDKIHTDFSVIKRCDIDRTDRLYAFVDIHI